MRHANIFTFDEFSELVRDALNSLYDTEQLSQHPLAKMLTFQASLSLQRTRLLRQILIDSIESMRPDPGTPANSPDWRGYYILEKRYIDGMTTRETIQELSISRAQYFRDQARVLDMLVEYLWEKLRHASVAQEEKISPATKPSISQRHISEVRFEMLDLNHLLQELQPLIDTVAEQKGFVCTYQFSGSPLELSADRVILRQILIALTGELVRDGNDGEIAIEVFVGNNKKGIRLSYSGLYIDPNEEQISIASRFAAQIGSEIQWLQREHDIEVQLIWSNEYHQKRLLVVDDNADIAELFKRYLTIHNWSVTAAHSVSDALQILEANIPPTAIVLDVMMPDEDGWDLLLTLKSNFDTKHIPVFVCSVVHNQDTAIALGANGYLAKPVTQATIVNALQPLMEN